MTYTEAIKTAILIFPLISFLFTIPFILKQYHKYGSINKLRTLIIYSFILYLITIYFLVILPLPTKEQLLNMKPLKPNLIPFNFITDLIKESPLKINKPSTYLKTILHPSFYTVIFNILMTIPFGIYLKYYYKYNFKKVATLSFFLSLFFEITQVTGLYFIYPRAYRLFDVDDLITNTLGGIIGYYLAFLVEKIIPSRDEIDRKSLLVGQKVSGLRRITLFFLDLTIYLTFHTITIFIFNYSWIKYITITIYYVALPYIWNNQTPGCKFLNIKLAFPKYPFLSSLIRTIIVYLYYVKVPILIIEESIKLNKTLNLNTQMSIVLYLAIFIILFITYIVTTFKILFNQKVFYDKLTKVEFQSTIKTEEETDTK